MQEIKTETLYSKEWYDRFGGFKIDIRVGGKNLPNLDTQKIRFASYDAEKLISNALIEAIIENNPESMERARIEKAAFIALFPGAIFVEEKPNGYGANDPYLKHLPWFVVTTKVGRFEIGWRKRVISIDWTQTVGTKTSDELFAAEDVTKDLRMIHAWSLEKAKQYIDAIINSALPS